MPTAADFYKCGTMLAGILRAKVALQAACHDPAFSAVANSSDVSSCTADEAMANLLLGRKDDAFDSAGVPVSLLSHPRFAAIYMAVINEDFWTRVDAYLQLNSIVVTCIAEVSKGCALLSDAALAYLSINDHVQALTQHSFPSLLTNNDDLATLQTSWADHMRMGMTDELYLSLLIDPRQHVREFVQSEQVLIGSVELNNFGATDAIHRALKVVSRYADMDVPADDKVVWV